MNNNFDDNELLQRKLIIDNITYSHNFDDFCRKMFGILIQEPFYSEWKYLYDSSRKWDEISHNVLKLGFNSSTGIDYTNDMQKAMNESSRYSNILVNRILESQLIDSKTCSKGSKR